MKYATILSVSLVTASLVLTGCDDKPATQTSTRPKDGPKDAAHPHGKGPNGGVVFDLGKYHAEFTVDHPKKECYILVIDGEDKDAKPLPITVKDLVVTTKETKTKEGKVVQPMTIKMLPQAEKDGKASKFVGTDPTLANVADFEGSVTAVIDGKPSQGSFKEE